MFANSASNFKSISRSLGQLLPVDQNNFGNKVPLFDFSFISDVDSNYQLGGFAILLTAWIAVMVV